MWHDPLAGGILVDEDVISLFTIEYVESIEQPSEFKQPLGKRLKD